MQGFERLGFWGVILLGVAGAGEGSEPRYPQAHAWAGLPVSTTPQPVFHADATHPVNRLHALLFLQELIPAEVGGVLPSERGDQPDDAFFQGQWYFQKRAGQPADRRAFGGDVRVSPVLTWPAAKTDDLLAVAQDVDHFLQTAGQDKFGPLSRLMLQWDLLSVWWRWEQVEETPPAVLAALARLIRQTAQPIAVLQELPSGWDTARKAFGGTTPDSPSLPYFSSDDVLDSHDGWIELSRRSSKLFVAPHSLRAARAFLKTETDPVAFVAKWSAPAATKSGSPAEHLETALVLSLVGITPDLQPVATPVIDEIRFRVVYRPEEMVDPQKTSSRDGSSFWIYFLNRSATTTSGSPTYRFVSDAEQGLFPEYGTAKHTTYAGQCALCHRLTNSGNQAPGGLRSLSSYANPLVSNDPAHRLRLAEQQMEVVVNRLRARLEAGAEPLPVARYEFRNLPK